MRTRHTTGGVRKQRGSWIGLWYEDGKKKSKLLGSAQDMTKGEARDAVSKIVLESKRDVSAVVRFREFVETVYFPYYSRKMEGLDAIKQC